MLFSKFIIVALCSALTLANAIRLSDAIRKRVASSTADYDCINSDPCTPENLNAGKRIFPSQDLTQYVECVPECLVIPCSPGTLWDAVINGCDTGSTTTQEMTIITAPATTTSLPQRSVTREPSTGHIDQCASSPCMNGGFCIDQLGRFSCQCPSGFTGASCQTNVYDCINSNPCTLENIEAGRTVFPNQDPTQYVRCLPQCYVDQCDTGMVWNVIANECDSGIDQCTSSLCMNGGSCIDQLGSFSCQCPSGFTGIFCQTIASSTAVYDCINSDPCTWENLSADKHIFPHQDPTQYIECVPQCIVEQCDTGSVFDVVANGCDFDQCASSPCMNGGSCIDQFGSFSCQCPSGFTGISCQTTIDIESVPVPELTAGFECNHFNICTFHDIVGRQLTFPNQDPTIYVQCIVMGCSNGLVWDAIAESCIYPTTGLSKPDPDRPITEEKEGALSSVTPWRYPR